MVVYVCAECGYETDKKYRIKNHFKKKFPCVKQRVVVSKEIMDAIGDDITLLKTNTAPFIKATTPSDTSDTSDDEDHF